MSESVPYIRPENLSDLKDRALAASAEGITIADARLPDMPIIYANEGFTRLTGYEVDEVVGRNCRFLQGDSTEPETVHAIRTAIEQEREVTVEILNRRKDGTPFWNRLSITPVKDEHGTVTHYLGIQFDITARIQAEASLAEASSRMQRNLQAASKVQRALLPEATPGPPGVRLAWDLRGCDDLAGDCLNIVPLDDHQVALYVVDVSGHGVPAALLSVTLSRWLSRRATDLIHGTDASLLSPVEVVEGLNRQFPMDMELFQYFTILYGIYDLGSHEFRYVAAGHPGPILVPADGQAVHHQPTGYPVGMMPQPNYQESTLELAAGDRLYLFSDGLHEAHDAQLEQFGMERVISTLETARAEDLKAVVDRVTDAVVAWAGGEPEDDISLLALEAVS